MGRLFKRKKYANMSHAEMVLTIQQQKEIYKAQMEESGELRRDIIEALDEIVDREVEIDETEVAERIAELCRQFNEEVPPAVAEALRRKSEQLNKAMNQKPHTCTQCGAPIHNGKCDYCGTVYK